MRTKSLWAMWLVPAFSLSMLVSCGGGGGSNSGGGSAVSGHVPYLISAPTITFKKSVWDSTKYDVTVTLEADGPTGVAFVSLWILDVADSSNFTSLDLARIPNTKRWTATTYYLLPLKSGQYYVDEIVLDDGDPLTADPLRTGWYFSDPFFSISQYYVDEMEESWVPEPRILFFNFGVSGISIARFSLP